MGRFDLAHVAGGNNEIDRRARRVPAVAWGEIVAQRIRRERVLGHMPQQLAATAALRDQLLSERLPRIEYLRSVPVVQAPFHGRPHQERPPDKTGHWVLIAIRSVRCQTANPRSSIFIEAKRSRASSSS